MAVALVGLAGRARSGKDTAAQHLVREWGFEKVAFADPIRDGLKAMFNLGDVDFEDDAKERTISWIGRSPRYLMQTLGTEWGRELVKPGIWLSVAEYRISMLQNMRERVVVSDVRFSNECELIQSMGGVVIWIERPDAPPVRNHESERGVAPVECDLILHNGGTISEFLDRLGNAVGGEMPHRGERAVRGPRGRSGPLLEGTR